MSHSDSPQHAVSATLDDMCSQAMDLQLAGRLELAEQLYRRILQADPQHATANHCIGMLNVQMRRPSDGLPHLLAALESNPKNPDYWLGYLEALFLAGQTDDAKETLAVARHHGLAGAAVEEFAARLEARWSPPTAKDPPAAPTTPPESSQPLESPKLSRTVRRRGARLAQKQEAALLAHVKKGNTAEGLALARTLTEDFPERGLGWKVVGALLWAERSTEDGLAAMQTAARLMPQDAETHNNLGLILIKLERFDEAERSMRRAVEIDPGSAAAYGHLADLYQLQGRYPEAEVNLRKALALQSDDLKAEDLRHTSLLFMLSHNPATDADSLFAEHCRVGEHLEGRLRAFWPKHPNSRDPDRRLQVGFISGDLCEHAVASFIEPVLVHLRNYPGLELHAYYNNTSEDNVSQRLRGYLQHWHPVASLSGRQLAKQIMHHGIDILIDLSGHTSLNRLRTFARKPAPLQASWIGYPGTTGLRAMDYYLTDRHFLPPGQFDRHFTEKLIYLPAGAPFQPHESAPPVSALPALATGSMSFGSFNRLGKINASTISLWSQLLLALPTARMIVASVSDGQQNSLITQFAAAGIGPERLTFHPRCSMDSYLALHHQVDICLDTHPYSGGTTTCHALWMGVPTLTIAGPTPAARQGAAFLGQLGLDGFIAANAANFVEKGLYWVNHLAALSDVRAGLRRRCEHSPARRPDLIAAGLERAMRQMWARWCAKLPAESFQISPESLG
jgi:predicted O-linked N-acetylglucosamine transferase (SPINDLY family)